MNLNTTIISKTALFQAQPSLEDCAGFDLRFAFFGFCNSNFPTEQGLKPCFQTTQEPG
jgi:hypothetical protein